MGNKHKAKPGKSVSFNKDFLKKVHKSKGVYDSELAAQAHEAIAAELRAGNIKQVTLRNADMEEASDGSGMPAMLTVIEHTFPHGKPEKKVDTTVETEHHA